MGLMHWPFAGQARSYLAWFSKGWVLFRLGHAYPQCVMGGLLGMVISAGRSGLAPRSQSGRHLMGLMHWPFAGQARSYLAWFSRGWVLSPWSTMLRATTDRVRLMQAVAKLAGRPWLRL